MNRVGIVLGYGIILNPGYQAYLDFVVRTCGDRDALVLCGGPTNPSKQITEAEVMMKYLHSQGVDQPFMLETRSYDTPSNLKNAQELIEENFQGQKLKVVVYCDQVRHFKVWWMSWWLFPKRTVRSVHRPDPSQAAWKQLLIYTPLENLAFHFRPIHRKVLQRRLKRWGFPPVRIEEIINSI